MHGSSRFANSSDPKDRGVADEVWAPFYSATIKQAVGNGRWLQILPGIKINLIAKKIGRFGLLSEVDTYSQARLQPVCRVLRTTPIFNLVSKQCPTPGNFRCGRASQAGRAWPVWVMLTSIGLGQLCEFRGRALLPKLGFLKGSCLGRRD